MKPLFKIALLLVLTLNALTSQAQEFMRETPTPTSPGWRYIITSDDGRDYHFIRKSSYGDIREIWIKGTPGDPLNEIIGGREIDITLRRYNCESGADRLLEVTTYQGNVKLRSTTYSNSDTEWSYSEPDTMGRAWLDAACGPRKREWTYITSSTNKMAHFLKLGTLSRTGNVARVWSQAVKGDERTSVSLSEFDCAAGRRRDLQTTTYSGNSGSTSTRPSMWTYVVPGTVGESLLKAACRTNRKPASRQRKQDPPNR
jgi:hypothetical protein